MAKSTNSEKVMGAVEVSDYLRISLSTVHHLTRSGKLRSRKVGKKWCYSKQDLDYYLEHGCMPEESTMKERRMHERFNCQLEGQITLQSGEELAWSGSGIVRNYSLGGVLFETSADIEALAAKKDDVEVKLDLDLGPSQNYELRGKIVYLAQPGVTRMGVQFNHEEPEYLQQMSHFLSHNQSNLFNPI